MMEPQSPSVRRYEKTRQEILDAARTILLEEGVEAISMRALAEKVDYSPAALYKYYSNKEEILEELRQEAWRLMSSAEKEPLPGASLADIFIESGRSYIEFATKFPAYYYLIMSPSQNGPKSMEEFKHDPNLLGLLQFLEAAVASGEFVLPQGYTPFHLALLSWFVVHAISLLKLAYMQNCPQEFDAVSLEVLHMIKALIVAKPGETQ
jgi:AcrR family transcriptional regulator